MKPSPDCFFCENIPSLRMLSCKVSVVPSINLCMHSMPVTNFSNLHPLVDGMHKVMIKENGIGIAAPQVGYNLMIVLLEPNNFDKEIQSRFLVNQSLCLINPQIKILDEKKIAVREGCLSLPDAELASVPRFNKIALVAQNIQGDQYSFVLDGIQSIILQHETDHLNGLLYPARVPEGARILEKYTRKKKISFTDIDKFSLLMKQNLGATGNLPQSAKEFIQTNIDKGLDEQVVNSIWGRIIEVNGC